MARRKVSESRLWAWMSQGCKGFGDMLHMDRVENMVMGGMPDVEGCLKGRQFWIELKCAARPAKPTTKIKPKFQPGQIPWIENRIQAGGKAYVLLQVGSGNDAGRYLVPGIYVHKVKAGATENELRHISVIHKSTPANGIVSAAAHSQIMRDMENGN